MNFSWPHRAAGNATRRRATRVWIVGAAAVAIAGAAALAAPGAFAATSAAHAPAKHATTTTMSGVSGYVGYKMKLTAKVKGGSTPKGWVKFIWGHTTLCSATLSNGTASCPHVFGGVGSLRVEALYEGNSTHKTSSAVATVKVMSLPTKATVTASADPTAGKPVTLTAVVAPSAATGHVTFSDAGGTLGAPVKVVGGKATLSYTWAAAGTYIVTGLYSGDATHRKSSGTTTVTVVKPPLNATTTVVTNPLFPITEPVDTPAAVNVMVTDDTAGGPAPTGNVTVTTDVPWADNAGLAPGTVYSCTAPLAAAGVNANGTAYSTGSCMTGGVGWGFIELGAIYSGDANNATSDTDGTEIKIVNLYPDTTTVTAPTGTAGDPVTLVATLGGPGGGNVLAASPEIESAVPPNPDTITFTVTDDTDAVVATCDVVPLAGGTTAAANYADCDVTLPAGTYTVTAVFAGDEYAAPSTGTATLTVGAGGGD
jgi:trimeric autotransporter adhesin